MKRRMHRLLRPDGRLLVVAMDHTMFMAEPVEGLADSDLTCRSVVAGGADAFLMPIGSAGRTAEAVGSAALIVSVDIADPFLEVAVERALAVGADAIKCMVYPFSGDDSVARATRLAADAARSGLPFLAEPIPGGFARTDLRSPETIAAGARIAAETGADMIKTFYTGDPESMRQVVEYASVPVLILGGGQRDTLRTLLQEVWDAVAVAGCAGVAIGNNIWRAADPTAVTRGLAAIIHEGATVDGAMEIAAPAVPS